MGTLFRSEEMTLCQLFLQSEAAYACVSELGELGLVQFRDLNANVNAFQRKFVIEVRRCDEMERRLRYLEKEIRRDGIPILETAECPEVPQAREIVDLEATLEKLESELREVNKNDEALKINFLELSELKHILRKTQVFFDEADLQSDTNISQMASPSWEEEQMALLGEEALRAGGEPQKLGFVAGVILREKIPPFERMLWRACRGNSFFRQVEIEAPFEDPSTGDPVFKSMFVIFFQGDQLKTRVKKICDGFHATLYPCPETPADRREMAMSVMTRIEDLNTVLGQTQDHRHRVLVAASKNIKNWSVKVCKIKAIYHTMNLFSLDVTKKCLIGECWMPLLDYDTIQMALLRGTERSGGSVPPILNKMETFEDPPTYNCTNKFTSGFQALIDAYGVASYREVNPAPYTIITFPFLFAVMFGDVGHGLIMFLFAGWMVLKEKKLAANTNKSEIWKIFFNGRYIIFLMGLFSLYTGFIYNDVFSKSLNIFGSHWKNSYDIAFMETHRAAQLNPADPNIYIGHPYPIGLDPVWQLAENKIIFQNAYKMKISIIFGVIHMLFGVTLSLWNHTYFKKQISIICEFIPQIIFLCFLFLYMVLLMFLKWMIYYPTDDPNETKNSPHCAPSILITFINMVLFKPTIPLAGCDINMYPGQHVIQKLLVILALLCVPWMLLAKPFYIIKNQRKTDYSVPGRQMYGEMDMDDEDDEYDERTFDNAVAPPVPPPSSSGEHAEEHDVSEMFIHQGIHTIEYVLGSVSHTASYLRLWALSLAHAQLSEVLWNMVMKMGVTFRGWSSGACTYVIFAAWACLTVSILVLMEGLSAFLHTLRLHWVEFQSKFYSGLGHEFQPFSFAVILRKGFQTIEE